MRMIFLQYICICSKGNVYLVLNFDITPFLFNNKGIITRWLTIHQQYISFYTDNIVFHIKIKSPVYVRQRTLLIK